MFVCESPADFSRPQRRGPLARASQAQPRPLTHRARQHRTTHRALRPHSLTRTQAARSRLLSLHRTLPTRLVTGRTRLTMALG
jgi:hypothetical protein